MSKAATYVVIPNWNGLDFIEDCLKSLETQTLNHEVIVVDNGSTDGSKELVDKRFPHVELIKLSRNTGFTGGVNAGIKSALSQGAELIALLNNDAIADKNWLANLVTVAKKYPEVGIVTGKLLRMDRVHLDSTGECYSVWGMPFPRGRNEVDKGQYDSNIEIFGATGGATLYKTELLKEIGLFDNDFFAYFEDVDISFRAQLAGWKVRFEPSALAYHHVSGTSSRLGNFARYHSTKNFLLTYARNMPFRLYFKYLPFFCVQLLRLLASSTLKGHPWTFFKGFLGAFRYHLRTIRKRRLMQGSRAVSTKYIDSILFHGRPPTPPELEKA